MKRLTIFLILLFSASIVCGGNFPFDTVTNKGQIWQLGVYDPGLLWAIRVENRIAGQLGTGKAWYVDSGLSSAGDGSSWSNALATVDGAINALSTDGGNNRGDFIYVAQGHAESGTDPDLWDADVNGITIIGLGEGSLRPTFTFADTDTTVAIGAANVSIRGLRFLAGISEVAIGVSVEALGIYFTMYDCEFPEPTTSTFEFNIAIQLTTASNDVAILGCKAYSADAVGADHWLNGGSGIFDRLWVIGNVVHGEFAIAPIFSDQVDLEVLIAGNTITNMTSGQYGIEFSANATGWLIGNKVSTDAIGTSYDPGRMSDGGDNFWDDFGTYDTSGVPWARPETGVNQLNATTITAIQAGLTGQRFFGDATTNAVATTVISANLSGFTNDYFNTGWSLVCILDATGPGSAPEGEIRDITDYVSSTGTFTVAAFTAALTDNDRIWVVRTELIDLYFASTVLESSNEVWYCDDGGTNGDGKTWATAKTTLAAAEALMSAGDTLYVGANHNENLTTGGDVINVAGVKVIGMGEGDARPLFDMDVDSDELTLSASGITLRNLRFRPGATGLTSGVRVEATGIGCTIDNCEFGDGEAAGTDEWVDAISVDTLASNLTVKNCTFYNTGAPGTFINLDEATIANATITGNKFFGACTEAPIWGAAAVPTNLSITNNDVQNTQTGQFCIEFQGAATGDCRDNMLSGDTYGAILDPGSMRLSGNMQTVGINASAEDVPLIAGKSYARQMLLGDVGALQNLFSVTGSPIIIEHAWGIASVAIGGAATLNWEVDADSGHDYDLSTAVDIQAIDEGGSIAFTDAMGEGVLTPQALGASGAGQRLSWFVEEGMIETDCGGDTGNVEWYILFKPVYSGCEVIPQAGTG